MPESESDNQGPVKCPSEDRELVRSVVRAVQEADKAFEKSGGGTKHWVRDWFLPILAKHSLKIKKIKKKPKPKPKKDERDNDTNSTQKRAIGALGLE